MFSPPPPPSKSSSGEVLPSKRNVAQRTMNENKLTPVKAQDNTLT